jgi:acetolactate synthase-1/2/3 large subunit/5-guanidino-2-oxopentanoate decarboxylase
MQQALGAELSHMLAARGVDVIFGVPGVHNQELYRGINQAGITHVLARHEQGAGFMADGYARASGKPGVAYVITGPGLCNIMTPMGQGYSDSVSMLVLSSCLDETASRKGQLHQMRDQAGAAACVCDWSEVAHSAEAAFGLVDRAFEEFETSRPRPKHVQVPISVLQGATDPAPLFNMPGVRVPASIPDIGAATSLLNIARRPLFVLGGGAKGGLWRQIAQQTGAAVFTTSAGRGKVGAGYALDFGATLARPGSADVIASADLVIAVGTELSEVDLWRPHLGHSAPMVRVDIDPAVLADDQRAMVRILSDADSFGRALWEATDTATPATGWTEAEVDQARRRWRAEADSERPGVLPYIDALRDAVPPETMIYSDMTQFAYVAKEVWPMDYPNHWHHPFGFGTLGYGLPAGIGGAIARNGIGGGGAPTLVIAGDYGLQYTLPELGVAVELGLSLPIIIWDNGKLKEIEESMQSAQIAPNAVQARNPDFCALAVAYGADSIQVSTPQALAAATKAAFGAGQPTVIHVLPGPVSDLPHP